MKKLVIASAALFSMMAGSAFAANTVFCAAPTAAAASTASITASGTTFVKQDITAGKVKCSANVHLVGNDGGSYFGVGAVSAKGKSIFQGSSAGGSVSSSGNCTTAGACTATEAATAATNAPSS